MYRHCGTAQTATAGQISSQSIGPFRPQKEKNKCNPLPSKCLLADEFPPPLAGCLAQPKKDAMRSDAEEVRHVYPERALGQSGMRKWSYVCEICAREIAPIPAPVTPLALFIWEPRVWKQMSIQMIWLFSTNARQSKWNHNVTLFVFSKHCPVCVCAEKSA